MKCDYCQAAVSQRENQCPNCGAPVNAQTNDTDKSPHSAGNHTDKRDDNNSPKKIAPLDLSAGEYEKYKGDEEIFKTKKSRPLYIFLALFLGCFGIHNLYAGNYIRATLQLLLTLSGCSRTIDFHYPSFLNIVVFLWVLVEIIVAVGEVISTNRRY